MSLSLRTGLLLIGLAPLLSAQAGYAIVSGRVQDASTAVVPGVTVTARNNNTGVTVDTVSNSQGYYTFTTLIPGTYSLDVSRAGFKNLERKGLVLQVGDHVDVDLTLEVGASNQQVTVTEQASLLRTDDAQSGMVIDNQRIQQLPGIRQERAGVCRSRSERERNVVSGGSDHGFPYQRRQVGSG